MLKIPIAILGVVLLPPMIMAQDTQTTDDSADTSAARAAIKKVQDSSRTSRPPKAPAPQPSTASQPPPATPSCSLFWSSWWDQLAANRQAVLRQPGTVDKMIEMGGGLEAIAADERLRSEEDDAAVFRQSQAQGQVPPGMTSEEYTAFRRGLIDIYHCRKGDQQSPATRVSKLNNCEEAAYYRDHQLVKDFDAAMSRYNAFRDGKLEQEKIRTETLKLMDSEWWGGKTAVQVAIEIKFYTGLFNDTVGWLAPDDYFERLYGKATVNSLEAVQHNAIAVDAMKKEAEEGAYEAAKFAFGEFAKEIMGQVGSFVGIYDDLKAHSEDRAKLAQAAVTVQRVAGNIQRTMNQYENRMQESRARANAIAAAVAAIDRVCAPASVAVPPR